MRRMISFKLENLPPNDRAIVDAWADGQKNLIQSLGNIVMHVVQYTGYDDVMEFENQRKLHTAFSNEPKIVVEQVVQKVAEKPVKQETEKPVPVAKTDELPSGDVMFDDD